MKNFVFVIMFLFIGITACDNSIKSNKTGMADAEISFKGTWIRSFEMGKDSVQFVYYKVWEDSIYYEMKGPFNLNYTIQKDTFLSKENRWVGNLDGNPYVIFVKNNGSDSITLFKKTIKSMDEALSMPYPSDTAKSRFSSWNVFYLKK